MLSRKARESLLLVSGDGKRIEIHVNRIKGKTVSLAVEAPPEVRIVRKELVANVGEAT